MLARRVDRTVIRRPKERSHRQRMEPSLRHGDRAVPRAGGWGCRSGQWSWMELRGAGRLGAWVRPVDGIARRRMNGASIRHRQGSGAPPAGWGHRSVKGMELAVRRTERRIGPPWGWSSAPPHRGGDRPARGWSCAPADERGIDPPRGWSCAPPDGWGYQSAKGMDLRSAAQRRGSVRRTLRGFQGDGAALRRTVGGIDPPRVWI